MSNPANFKAAESTVQVTPLELTPAQINDVNEVTYGSYFGRYAVIKGATVASNAVTVDGESVTTYNRFGVSAPSDSEGKTYNVFGVVGYYNAVQFMPLEYAEVQEPAGVTLAEALAGEDGDVTITDDLKVVVVNSAYAILSDGNDNWIKVTGADDLEQNQVVTDVKGTITLSLNPVMNVNSFTESDNEVNVELDRLDLRTIHREALTALKPNEVATFVGYYNAETGELCAFSSGSGLHIGMSTDYMVGTISAGKQQAITGVVSLKEAWDVPTTNAPARVAIDDDQAFENIQIDAASASTPTGIADVKTLDGKEIQGIYNVNGQQVSRADKGVYIIRYTDGTAAKVRF